MNNDHSNKLNRLMKLWFLMQTEVATLDECNEYTQLYTYFNGLITAYENWQDDNF